jgi:hypothetical protein
MVRLPRPHRRKFFQSRGFFMQTVLVTGAAGGIGTRLRKLLDGVYPNLRWSDIRAPADMATHQTFVQADLADLAQVEKLVDGVDGIVHLGGESVEQSWDRILQAKYHRLLQPVRGGAAQESQTRRLRLIEPRGRLLSAAAQDRHRRAGAP